MKPPRVPPAVGTIATGVACVAIAGREWAIHRLSAAAPQAATVADLDGLFTETRTLSAVLLTLTAAALVTALVVAWSTSRGGPTPTSQHALGWWVITSAGLVTYAAVVGWRAWSREQPGGSYWISADAVPPPHLVEGALNPPDLPSVGLLGIALAAASAATYAWYVNRQTAPPR
ncbi:hypothetical protein SAMN05421812_108242 [Asanoa hainanensis]|uniref:Uncharacterized protein n=1 Tax=Asanoa hainanensis TaxID=560556 RepID=A0A239NFP5_9ACTN|nr:hypothetical protein [Asanoa hainanensis]SNT53313.1 hypothetical protein SAMN05421812_108242 [Asanoa hainanensis]